MSDAATLARLRSLASALIPGAGGLPDLDRWLDRALRAGGWPPPVLAAALAALPEAIDFDGAKRLATARPEAFAVLGTLVSAAYFMAPQVLRGLGFPEDRRNPAGTEDFLAEYETGVFEPMLSRAPMFRDPRQQDPT